MSADDQTFLDTLNAVPNDIKRFTGDIADYVDSHIERVALLLRETLSSQGWIPESARPSPPPKPSLPAKVLPAGIYNRVKGWVDKHKLFTGSIVFGVGIAVYFAYRRRRHYSKKRRAKRASNGARLEVVVIAGSPNEPATRSIALDLERRGYIVFVVCNDVEEEVMVQNEARSDIKPLLIDLTLSVTSGNSIERLASYFQTPQYAFEGARPHHVTFKALIIIPSLNYPSAPIATMSPSHISDLLNTRLLHPILVTQAFLPLLSSPAHHSSAHLSSGYSSPVLPKVLVLTPTIIASLSPPFHAFESLVVSALNAFTRSLCAELAPLGIPVTHLKLGSFDFSSLQPRNQLQIHNLNAQRAEMLSWPEGARRIYGKNYMSVTERDPNCSGSRGCPLRELHNAVFDAMASRKGGTVRVGMGSVIYGFVGAWVPGGLVGWMMGMREISRSNVTILGNESGSDGYKDDLGMTKESGYVSVYQ